MAGKGDKWRKTNFKKYRENWPKDMGKKDAPDTKMRELPKVAPNQSEAKDRVVPPVSEADGSVCGDNLHDQKTPKDVPRISAEEAARRIMKKYGKSLDSLAY